MEEEMIKCNKCGHILMKGAGCVALLGAGITLGCGNCGHEEEIPETNILSPDREFNLVRGEQK